MSILEELTKDFQYEENLVNPEIRKLISGNFRGLLVNKNGFCYCGSNTKTMKLLTKRGYYGSTTEDKTWIKPWRLTALVWYDQTPSLHLIDSEKDKDKYLNLLAFIKVLEKYPDEYELLMNELKTDYYPLSRGKIFNVVTGVIGVSTHNFKIKHPFEYERINWYFFEEIGDKIELDFQKFKNELSEELKNNLESESPKVTNDEEEEPEEELEVCLSNTELGGAPSLKPKVKTISKENKMDDCSEREKEIDKLIIKLIKASEKHDGAGTFHLISELRRMGLTHEEINERAKVLMKAQDSSVLEENELRGYRDCTSSPNVAQKDTEEDKTDVSSSSGSIEELQELFDRRAKLKKELDEIEEKIKASIFH